MDIFDTDKATARSMLHELDFMGFDEFSSECEDYLVEKISSIRKSAYREGRDDVINEFKKGGKL